VGAPPVVAMMPLPGAGYSGADPGPVATVAAVERNDPTRTPYGQLGHLDECLAELARLRRRDLRRAGATSIGLVVFGGFLVANGWEIPAMLVLGGWIFGLGVVLLVGWRLRVRLESGDGPRGSVRVGLLGDRRTTVLRDHPVDEVLAAMVTASLTVLFGGWGLISAREHLGLGMTLVAVGFGFLVSAVRHLVRWRATGLWLGAEQLVQRADGEERAILWSDVRYVSDADGPASSILVLPFERSQVGARPLRRRRPRLRLPDGMLSIRTLKSPFPPAELAAILQHYAAPGRAAELVAPVTEDHLRRLAVESSDVPS
jgi:hypothetical protein